MSYSVPQQPAARAGKPWTLIIGGVIALLALLLCCGGGFLTFSTGQEIADSPERTGSHEVQLDEGESVAVWSTDDLATCSAQGPAGPVSDSGGASQTVTWGEDEYERIMVVEADEDGSYTITCSAPFVVGDDLPTVGFIGIFAGGALCCLSVVVIIVGLVLWLNKRKR